ncbi:thiamine pyrophosphate-dependent enzyme [Streptomyces diastatochromogenes]|nr:thiamine pyrophosphate-dependent enzyme [Streptomyces diastatochromogenes]
MWGYHHPVVSVGDRARVITPGEQTMVGFGLPAAVGAALADRSRRTVLVCGDGAFEMGFAALPTAAELNLGLTVLVLDNRGYGWPRFVRAEEEAPDELTRFTAPRTPTPPSAPSAASPPAAPRPPNSPPPSTTRPRPTPRAAPPSSPCPSATTTSRWACAASSTPPRPPGPTREPRPGAAGPPR